MVVKNGHGYVLWSTNVSIGTNSCTASLSDNGNLLIVNSNNKVLWQSFQHPTDTFLPEMKVFMDGILRSWTSESDPSPGRYVIFAACDHLIRKLKLFEKKQVFIYLILLRTRPRSSHMQSESWDNRW